MGADTGALSIYEKIAAACGSPFEAPFVLVGHFGFYWVVAICVAVAAALVANRHGAAPTHMFYNVGTIAATAGSALAQHVVLVAMLAVGFACACARANKAGCALQRVVLAILYLTLDYLAETGVGRQETDRAHSTSQQQTAPSTKATHLLQRAPADARRTAVASVFRNSTSASAPEHASCPVDSNDAEAGLGDLGTGPRAPAPIPIPLMIACAGLLVVFCTKPASRPPRKPVCVTRPAQPVIQSDSGAPRINANTATQDLNQITGEGITKREQEVGDAGTMRGLHNIDPNLAHPLFRSKITGAARNTLREVVRRHGGEPRPRASVPAEKQRFPGFHQPDLDDFTLSAAELGQMARENMRERECDSAKPDKFAAQ